MVINYACATGIIIIVHIDESWPVYPTKCEPAVGRTEPPARPCATLWAKTAVLRQILSYIHLYIQGSVSSNTDSLPHRETASWVGNRIMIVHNGRVLTSWDAIRSWCLWSSPDKVESRLPVWR